MDKDKLKDEIATMEESLVKMKLELKTATTPLERGQYRRTVLGNKIMVIQNYLRTSKFRAVVVGAYSEDAVRAGTILHMTPGEIETLEIWHD